MHQLGRRWILGAFVAVLAASARYSRLMFVRLSSDYSIPAAWHGMAKLL